MSRIPAALSLRLRGTVGGGEVSIPLRRGTHVLGAGEACSIILSDSGISRRHVELEVRKHTINVLDLASKNGTFVNGKRIHKATLTAGDVLGLGATALVVELIDDDDLDLGIACPAYHQVGTRKSNTRTDSLTEHITLLGLLSQCAAALIDGSDESVFGILKSFRQGVAAKGLAIVEFAPDQQAVIVASTGAVPGDEILAEIGSSCQTTPDHQAVPEMQSSRDPNNGGVEWLLVRAGKSVVAAIITGRPSHEKDLNHYVIILLYMIMLQRWRSRATVSRDRSEDRDLHFPPGYIRGTSSAMERLYGEMKTLARTDLPVLIVGETGVGKEYIARILHASSDRCHRPFLAVNCAAIPKELLEAELFGIGKAVATGVAARPGTLVQADGGSLFLDEIGEMPAELQAKMLRALEEREVCPLGSAKPVPVDIRLISATNMEIDSVPEKSSLRPDLFYRIAGFTLRVPPLRERRDDIAALIERFLRDAIAEGDKPVRGVTVKALRLLESASWPGNVRQLQHVVRALVYRTQAGAAIEAKALPTWIRDQEDRLQQKGRSTDFSLHSQVESLERRLITDALHQTDGNRTAAARLLGISRAGLHKKIERLHLE